MTLILERGTLPKGLGIKTWGFICDGKNTIYLGEYQISLEDFLCAAHYVLTNTDLDANDPRRQFVKCVQSLQEVEGYMPGYKRLKASESPVLVPPQKLLIEIVKIPAGPAPEWVREKWVGVKLTAFTLPPSAMEIDFLSGKLLGNRGGVYVKVQDSLEKLAEKSPEAAQWFKENLPQGMRHFAFGPDEIRILPDPSTQ